MVDPDGRQRTDRRVTTSATDTDRPQQARAASTLRLVPAESASAWISPWACSGARPRVQQQTDRLLDGRVVVADSRQVCLQLRVDVAEHKLWQVQDDVELATDESPARAGLPGQVRWPGPAPRPDEGRRNPAFRQPRRAPRPAADGRAATERAPPLPQPAFPQAGRRPPAPTETGHSSASCPPHGTGSVRAGHRPAGPTDCSAIERRALFGGRTPHAASPRDEARCPVAPRPVPTCASSAERRPTLR